MGVDMGHGRFTWSNLWENASCSRLDRFLVSVDWEDHFSHVQVLPLTRFTSDHKHILLKTSRVFDRRHSFRLEMYWFREGDFMEAVSSAWRIQVSTTSAMTTLVKKPHHTTQVLKAWGADKTLSWRAAKDMIVHHIEGLDVLEDGGLLDGEDRSLRDSLRTQFNEILFREEVY